MQLLVMKDRLAVCRLSAADPLPVWAWGPFCSLTLTSEELSVVCVESAVPENLPCERGWRAIQVRGPLDFALTGVLASLTGPLAQAGVSIFAISTFDTDYVLVRAETLDRAADVLRAAGHEVE
jgi:uncharacterized protein